MLLAAAALLACGGDVGSADETPTPSALIVMVNETPCVLHFRFDNGAPRGRIPAGETLTFEDPEVATARFVKFESTRAIFRTYDMAAVRADGDRIVVGPAADDRPCFETRAGLRQDG